MSPYPLKTAPRVPVDVRLARRRLVDPVTQCWEWQGHRDRNGYGRITVEGRSAYVHRVSWQEAFGRPVPKGRVMDHVCENRACFNPDHLELVSTSENTKRRKNSQSSRTHCVKGHRYAGSNLRIYLDAKGRPHRHCVICNKIRSREWQEKRKSEANVI